MSFFFSKTENRKTKQVVSGGLVSISGRGEDIRKGYGRLNMVQI
jgi:ribosome-associated protein YbcJ (S4-like RNA binding protein)